VKRGGYWQFGGEGDTEGATKRFEKRRRRGEVKGGRKKGGGLGDQKTPKWGTGEKGGKGGLFWGGMIRRKI